MLVLKNINVTLAKETKFPIKILKDLNLIVSKGDFIIIVGGNGAGKSTIFNLISGDLKQDSGSILIDNKNFNKTSPLERTKLVSQVMQDPKTGTITDMNIYENMSFALLRGQKRNLKIFKNYDNTILFKQKLSLLNMGLENRLSEKVFNLSGGMRQALSFIMATLQNTQILLLDEITSALDPKSSDTVIDLCNNIITTEKLTCLMITHNLEHAIKYGNRLLILKNGNFAKEYDQYHKNLLTTDILYKELEKQ